MSFPSFRYPSDGLWRGLLRLHRSYHDFNWAMVDQAVVSAVNFLTIVIIARNLGVEEFGVFSIAWLILLFFKDMQFAMILAPMMSIGPKQIATGGDSSAAYFTGTLTQQAAFGGASFLVIVVGAWGATHIGLDTAILERVRDFGFVLAATAMADQAQDYIRRYFYTHRRFLMALGNDLVCYLGRLAILVVIFWRGDVDGPKALWAIFASATVAVALGALALRLARFDMQEFLADLRRHWDFSKWLSSSALLRWLSGHLIVLVAGSVLGAQAVGAIRSTTNVLAPAQVLLLALTNIAPVHAARVYSEHGKAALVSYLRRLTAFGFLSTCAIAIVGAVFSEEIVVFLYGDDYLQYAFLVDYFAFVYVVGFLIFPLEVALKAVEHTRPFLFSVIAEASFAIASAYALASLFGLPGVMFGILMTKIIPASCLAYCWVRYLRRN